MLGSPARSCVSLLSLSNFLPHQGQQPKCRFVGAFYLPTALLSFSHALIPPILMQVMSELQSLLSFNAPPTRYATTSCQRPALLELNLGSATITIINPTAAYYCGFRP